MIPLVTNVNVMVWLLSGGVIGWVAAHQDHFSKTALLGSFIGVVVLLAVLGLIRRRPVLWRLTGNERPLLRSSRKFAYDERRSVPTLLSLPLTPRRSFLASVISSSWFWSNNAQRVTGRRVFRLPSGVEHD